MAYQVSTLREPPRSWYGPAKSPEEWLDRARRLRLDAAEYPSRRVVVAAWLDWVLASTVAAVVPEVHKPVLVGEA
jgi:hypothetical protein